MPSITEFVNRIICGDCRQVMRTMPAASVDFVLTDPPYLVNYHSRDGRSIANDSSDAWLTPAFAEVARVLKANSFCVSFYGFTQAEKFLLAWKAAGLRPVEQLVWHKRYASSEGFVRRYHEAAYLLAKGQPRRPRVRLPSVLTEWRYTGDTLHPTQKPTSALSPLIMAYSKPHDIVLDPFAGSGSTAVAAHDLGRRYIGIEIDAQYARVAAERLRRGRFVQV